MAERSGKRFSLRKKGTSKNGGIEVAMQNVTLMLIMVYHVQFKFRGLCETPAQIFLNAGPLLHIYFACSGICSFQHQYRDSCYSIRPLFVQKYGLFGLASILFNTEDNC